MGIFKIWRDLAKDNIMSSYRINDHYDVTSQYPTIEFPRVKRGINISNFPMNIPFDKFKVRFLPLDR